MPLMVLSKFCVLHKASGRELQEQNECIYDQGGCVLRSLCPSVHVLGGGSWAGAAWLFLFPS